MHHAYAKHAEVTVPSLDDWEKQWKENPQQITPPKVLLVNFRSVPVATDNRDADADCATKLKIEAWEMGARAATDKPTVPTAMSAAGGTLRCRSTLAVAIRLVAHQERFGGRLNHKTVQGASTGARAGRRLAVSAGCAVCPPASLPAAAVPQSADTHSADVPGIVLEFCREVNPESGLGIRRPAELPCEESPKLCRSATARFAV